jgi:hypothetical protein
MPSLAWEGPQCETPKACENTGTPGKIYEIDCGLGDAVNVWTNDCACDCGTTGMEGSNCQTASNCYISDSGDPGAINCQNGGAAYGTTADGCNECDCDDTGFTGALCNEPMSCVLGSGDAPHEIDCQNDAPAGGDTLDGCYCDCTDGYEGELCDGVLPCGLGSGGDDNEIE